MIVSEMISLLQEILETTRPRVLYPEWVFAARKAIRANDCDRMISLIMYVEQLGEVRVPYEWLVRARTVIAEAGKKPLEPVRY